jgi:steroid 5-alpha reductase family enzyme
MIVGAFVVIWATVWFVISLRAGRMDVADIAWGPGIAAVALLTWVISDEPYGTRSLIMTGMVVVWGARLAWHIGRRNAGKPEDARYRKWREEWGDHVHVRSFLQVFLLQSVLMAMVALPVWVVNAGEPVELGWVGTAGALIWLFGFIYEAVADRQLAQFLSDPGNKGKVLDTGLWGRSRHPNYFGEVVLWWGLGFMALATPWGWVGLAGPAVITFLILCVSGVPMLERKMESDPKYAAYLESTPVFWPTF